jgi:Zn-dependent membrane protease YugP
LFPQEIGGASAVLNAAALTYVAAAVQALSTLLYYGIMLIGINRD